ncbi:AAA family ATPase [Spirillospora sp. CA-253888]
MRRENGRPGGPSAVPMGARTAEIQARYAEVLTAVRAADERQAAAAPAAAAHRLAALAEAAAGSATGGRRPEAAAPTPPPWTCPRRPRWSRLQRRVGGAEHMTEPHPPSGGARGPLCGRGRPSQGAVVTDLRADPDADDEVCRGALWFAAGDVVVVSGLPGSGKSTLIEQSVAGADARGGPVAVIDSQHVRRAWQERVPSRLPYAAYRPLVRICHYVRLGRALGSTGGVVVHDCGGRAWVRRWAVRQARRRDRRVHLLLLDVPPPVAAEGQRSRRRTVSGRAFRRHRRATAKLIAGVAGGRAPDGCASAVLLDRRAATGVRTIGFF